MDNHSQNENFLPNICDARYLLIIVLLGELFTITVWLASLTTWPVDWIALGKSSMFVQWASLWSAFFICALRNFLGRFSPLIITVTCLAVVEIITAGTTIAAYNVFGSDKSIAILLVRNCAIALILAAFIFNYLFMRQVSHRDTAAKHQATIEALQARIRPHFLFNCLNTIAALIRHAPEQAEQTVEDLADLFRASIADVKTIVSLEEELDLIDQYLRIEHVRVGERLHVKWDIDPIRNKNIKLPLLSIQPIVENAIYHGVEQMPEGGTITIIGFIENDKVMIEVTNPIPKKIRNGRRSLHIAIDNTRQRLQLAFEGRATMELDETDGLYTVTLTLPMPAGEST